jgi:hypothetical protein
LEDIATVHLYTQQTPLFGKMNAALRDLGAGNTALIVHYLPYINLLLKALNQLARVDLDQVLYRGVKRPHTEVIGVLKVGDVLVLDAFSSASRSPDVLRCNDFLGVDASQGPRTVFQLRVRNGVSIQHLSAFGDFKTPAKPHLQKQEAVVTAEVEGNNEEEVLVLPGIPFRISSIKACPNKIMEVRMEEIAPEGGRPWWLAALGTLDFSDC